MLISEWYTQAGRGATDGCAGGSRVANCYFVNPAIGIQMSAHDLLSGTLTFLLFVILTPFVGAGSHAASCLSVLVRETQQHTQPPAPPAYQRAQKLHYTKIAHYHSLHINFTRIHSVFTAPQNSAIIMIIAPIHECSIWCTAVRIDDWFSAIIFWFHLIVRYRYLGLNLHIRLCFYVFMLYMVVFMSN